MPTGLALCELARTNVLPAELPLGADGLALCVDLVGLATVLGGAVVESQACLPPPNSLLPTGEIESNVSGS